MAVTDYASTSMVGSLGATFYPDPQLTLRLQGNIIQTEGSFDPVQMPDVSQEILDEIHSGNYDYSEIHEYSDLDYQQLEVGVSASYQFAPDIRFDLGATYYDLTDDEGWVYGNETGSLWIVRAGVQLGM